MFCERLKKFRQYLNLNKRQMAKKLEVTESYYNVIENAKKKPSKNFITKLVSISEKSEEYWMYGVNKNAEVQLIKTFEVVNNLIELNLCNDLFVSNSDGDLIIQKSSLEELIMKALKSDIEKYKNNN